MNLHALFLLAVLFVVSVGAVARGKGMRALVILFLTAGVLVKIIVPQILAGKNPLLVISLASSVLTPIIIYATEGVSRKSHVAVMAVVAQCMAVSGLTVLAVWGVGLTGLTNEETAYVGGFGSAANNLPGIVEAGILIGIVGVLIEMVVTQVATVVELKTNEKNKRELFAKSYRVGSAHVGSLINTLFLIYAGASLPVLIILIGGGYTLSDLLHSELIVTEIVRTFVASIGLVTAMPLSTALATWLL